ncbi:Uncharacterised protein [Klebsiella pneumoniae]|nr:Uncharacterised protein [Klebsiella pneumoniae]
MLFCASVTAASIIVTIWRQVSSGCPARSGTVPAGPLTSSSKRVGVIEQHRGRSAPKWRIKGHVFAPKRGFAQTRVERKELIRGICGFRRRRRGMWRRRSHKIQHGIAGPLSRRFHRPAALSRTQWRDTGRSQNYRKLTGEAQLSDHPAGYRRTQIDTGRIPDSCRLWGDASNSRDAFSILITQIDAWICKSPVQRLRHIECGHPHQQ